MTVQPGIERVQNYELKFDPEVIKQQTEKRRQRMVDKLGQQAEALVELETKAKEVLGQLGVPTFAYPAYLNFVREGWKKKGRFLGETLRREALVLLVKWQLRGLDEVVLVTLRDQVLTIGPPGP